MRVCDEYQSLPAFILGITERIWEGRDIALIRDTYGADVVMHTASGDAHGVERVVSGTLETLHAFPDRRLFGEDVIWAGTGPYDAYSSHRIVSTQHHRGDGLFGPPTGRAVLARTVADCLIRDGMIVEEWLVRDQGAIAAQVGTTPRELGARLAALRSGEDRAELPMPFSAAPAHGHFDDEGGRCAASLSAVWNEARLRDLRALYDPAVTLHLPGGVCASGHAAADAFVVGYLASFPDARFAVEHAITRIDPGRPVRVALRWRLAGTHSGFGTFGPPSGASVAILGITHLELVDGLVIRAFELVDELAVWTEVGRARG